MTHFSRRALGVAAAAGAGSLLLPAAPAAASSCQSLHRLADRFVRLANAHDLEGLVGLHDPQYFSHEANGQIGYLDAYRARTAGFFGGFSDGWVRLVNAVVEGDLLVVNILTGGTNDGVFLGRPATGKKVEFAEVRVWRVARGLIVEQWGMIDLATLQAQLAG